MSIRAHLEQRRRPIESRVGPRRKLRLETSGANSSGDMNVVVHDMSETGLLLQTSAQLSVGEKIEVVLPNAGPTAASVVWGSNEFFGCRFEKRVSRATVSASQLQGDTPAAAGPSGGARDDDGGAAPLSDPLIKESFGARLRRLRKERQVSLIGLARLVGVSKPTVWKWEKDDVRPRQKSIEALASALGVSERELLLGAKAAEGQAGDSPRAAGDGPTALGQLVRDCKDQIAEAAGTSADNISITIQI
jgi:transcriptional regulator with XRE-family HTH domain